MYNALPLHFAPHHISLRPLAHFTSFHIESTGIIPNHTTFHVAPFLTTSHNSYHTSTSSRSTLFHFAIPYFKSHHIGHIMNHTTNISHAAPHFTLLTYHITPHSMYSTPHQFPITPYVGRIIYASLYRISHHILHNIAPHFTCSPSCIIPPHLTVITPNSTSHCHVPHNIPHHRSVHHHLPHLA